MQQLKEISPTLLVEIILGVLQTQLERQAMQLEEIQNKLKTLAPRRLERFWQDLLPRANSDAQALALLTEWIAASADGSPLSPPGN